MVDDCNSVVYLFVEVFVMSLGDDFEREDFELGFDGVEEDVEDDSDDEELMVIFGFV